MCKDNNDAHHHDRHHYDHGNNKPIPLNLLELVRQRSTLQGALDAMQGALNAGVAPRGVAVTFLY